MKAILIVEYDDEFSIDDLMIDYTLFHQEQKVFKMFNEKLKPIPNKYELTTEKGNRYAVGWNDCIDEILREEK